jgi:hypothetical protein
MSVISQTVRPSSTPDILITNLACDPSVAAGDWVRYDSNQVVIKARANSFANSTIFGLVEEKGSSTICTVRVAGVSKEIFVNLDVSLPYFLDSSNEGAMTFSPPTDSGSIVLSLGRPISDKRFLVQPSLRLQRS